MGIVRRSKEKEAKEHPPVLQRHNTYSYPGTPYYHDHEYWLPYSSAHPGMPMDGQNWGPWFHPAQRHHNPVGLQRVPSLRSTSATASDSQDSAPSLVTNVSSYLSSGSHYSGHNSLVYSPNTSDMTAPSQVHGLLDATSAPLVWDVRTQPKLLGTTEMLPKHFYGSNTLSFPFLSSGSGHVRILSSEFPWVITLGPKSRALTAGEILQAIYELLDKNLDNTAWILSDEQKKTRIKRAKKKRSDVGDCLKNVDWLEKNYMFKGFYKDDTVVQQRLPPGSEDIAETWLVAFKSA